jgi:hypothetical protein
LRWLILLFSTFNDGITFECARHLTVPTLKDVTVDEVLQAIVKYGRERYHFTEHGEGCRFWTHTFVSDLEKEGTLEKGNVEVALPNLNLYWRYPRGTDPGYRH